MKTTKYKERRLQALTAAVAALLDCAKAAHGVGEQAAEAFHVLAADLRYGIKKLDEAAQNVAYIMRQGDVVMTDDVRQLLHDLRSLLGIGILDDSHEYGETPFGGRYWGVMLFLGWSMVCGRYGANSKVWLRVRDWAPQEYEPAPKGRPNAAQVAFLNRYGFRQIAQGEFDSVWPIHAEALGKVLELIRTKKSDPECEANRAEALELLNASWQAK